MGRPDHPERIRSLSTAPSQGPQRGLRWTLRALSRAIVSRLAVSRLAVSRLVMNQLAVRHAAESHPETRHFPQAGGAALSRDAAVGCECEMSLSPADIRLARTCDAEVIAAMSRDCIESGLVWSWTVPRVLRAMADPGSNVAVLTAGSTIVGFGIMSYGEDVAHLALLAVHSAYRSRGLGGRLLEWLEKPARVAGISRVRLEARSDNPRAIEFYRRCGYRVATRVPGYYQGCIDALRLEKTLCGYPDEAAGPGRPHSQRF